MINYTYKQFSNDVEKLSQTIACMEEVSTPHLKWQPNTVVSIARGGLVPGVYLSHSLNIKNVPIVWQTRDGCTKEPIPDTLLSKGCQLLIVDDINDSGETFHQIMDDIKRRYQHGEAELKQNIKTATLWSRSVSNFHVDFTIRKIDTDEWIIFPWEKG